MKNKTTINIEKDAMGYFGVITHWSGAVATYGACTREEVLTALQLLKNDLDKEFAKGKKS